jgi:hypothetical protein
MFAVNNTYNVYRQRFSELQYCVHLQVVTDVWDEHIFCIFSLSPKQLKRPHGVTTQEPTDDIFTALRTSISDTYLCTFSQFTKCSYSITTNGRNLVGLLNLMDVSCSNIVSGNSSEVTGPARHSA